MDLNNEMVEKFTVDRIQEGTPEQILMGMTEDELVFMDGILKTLADLTEMMGAEESIELAAMMCRFDEASCEYYDATEPEEDEEEL